MMVQPRAKAAPLSVGRFQLTGRASIGIADVHRARDASDNLVAVYLAPEDAAGRDRGWSAAFAASVAMDHPNVLRIIDFGRAAGFEYLATEWVEGVTLARMIQTHGRLPEANVIRFLAQIGQALDQIRNESFAPCRVTPGNVLLRSDGLAKIIPFPLPHEPPPALIGTAAALLKPEFAAALSSEHSPSAGVPFPEVIAGLGTTLYEALTGSPWQPAVPEPPSKKRRRAPPPLPTGLTNRTDRAIRRATDREVEQRPASCAEFLKMLRARTPAAGTKKVDVRTPSAATDNRRGCVRYALGVGSNCTINASVFDPPDPPADSAAVWPLVVQDVSATGIALLLARRCEPGTELSVEVASAPGRAARCLPVRVVRVRRDHYGHWLHGCTFFTELDRAELAGLLDGLGRADGV